MPTPAEKKKCFRKRRSVEEEEADAGAESGDEEERRLALEEVKLLQKKRERRYGILALPTAEPSVAGAGDQNIGGLKKVGAGGGGGGGGDGEKEDLVLQDTFAQETAVTIEDPNMMKYVEQELAKQRGRSIDGDKGDQVESELKCLEDELYAVPEHLKVKRRNSEESSTQWTTGIAEVQLPIELTSFLHAPVLCTTILQGFAYSFLHPFFWSFDNDLPCDTKGSYARNSMLSSSRDVNLHLKHVCCHICFQTLTSPYSGVDMSFMSLQILEKDVSLSTPPFVMHYFPVEEDIYLYL